jgi:hypothetical protein
MREKSLLKHDVLIDTVGPARFPQASLADMLMIMRNTSRRKFVKASILGGLTAQAVQHQRAFGQAPSVGAAPSGPW